jgi:hypothetical protein
MLKSLLISGSMLIFALACETALAQENTNLRGEFVPATTETPEAGKAAPAPSAPAPAPAAEPVTAPQGPATQSPTSPPQLSLGFGDTIGEQAMLALLVDRVDQRQERRLNLYFGVTGAFGTLALAVLAFLGFTQLREIRRTTADAVRQELKQDLLDKDSPVRVEIVQSIETSLTREVHDTKVAFERERAFLRLQTLALKVKEGSSFTRYERDTIFENLLAVADDRLITQRDEMKMILEPIIDSFFAASLWSYLDKIEDKFWSIISQEWVIAFPMMQGFAMRLLGGIDYEENVIDQFKKYAKVCRDLNYYESSLPYLFAHEHSTQRAGWQQRFDDLYSDFRRLTEQEQANANRAIHFSADPAQLAKTPKPEHFRMAQKFRALIDAYPDRFPEPPVQEEQDEQNQQPQAPGS